MIDYEKLSGSKPTVNYDTINLTTKGYELKFSLDSENPELQEVINRCEDHSWPYKIIDGEGQQKHAWIKGWVKE